MSDADLDPTAEAVQTVMSFSDDAFETLIGSLNTADVPLSQSQLETLIRDSVPEDVDSEQMTAFSVAFAGTLYWGAIEPDQAVRRISKSTSSRLGVEAAAIEARLISLLRSRAILLVSGAQAARRKTAGLIERSAVHTDARAVVHPDQSDVQLYSIYHRLHLVVTDDEAGQEERAIELVLDRNGLEDLSKKIAASLKAERAVQAALGASGASVYLPVGEG